MALVRCALWPGLDGECFRHLIPGLFDLFDDTRCVNVEKEQPTDATMRTDTDVVIWKVLGVLNDLRNGCGRIAELVPQDATLLAGMDRSDTEATGDLTCGYFEVARLFPRSERVKPPQRSEQRDRLRRAVVGGIRNVYLSWHSPDSTDAKYSATTCVPSASVMM